MKSGIYTITNLVNGKVYIGYCKDFIQRERVHFSYLKSKRHVNHHLQRAYNKYGKENFVFEVLVECSEEFLTSEEHYWCTLLNVHNGKYGYNVRPTHPYDKSKKQSEESKRKIGESNKISLKGKNLSQETKNKLRKRSIENGSIKHLVEKFSIPVQIEYDGVTKSYPSISALCRDFGFKNAGVECAIKNQNLYLGKYRFKKLQKQ